MVYLSAPSLAVSKFIVIVFQQERQNVEDLQRALSLAKQKYKATLQSLESISESIHEKRRVKASSHLPLRTPGVGAESIYSQSSDTSDLPSINLGKAVLVAVIFLLSNWGNNCMNILMHM